MLLLILISAVMNIIGFASWASKRSFEHIALFVFTHLIVAGWTNVFLSEFRIGAKVPANLAIPQFIATIVLAHDG